MSLVKSNPRTLDEETLRTFFAEAEGIVNSRPLTLENLHDPESAPLACDATRFSMNVDDSNLPRSMGAVRHSKPSARDSQSAAARASSVARMMVSVGEGPLHGGGGVGALPASPFTLMDSGA